MKIASLVALCWLGAAVSGCASQVDYKAHLQKAPLCCTHLSEIRYQRLEYGTTLSRVLGAKGTDAREFQEGKSFFLAVRLPEFNGPYELQISSKPKHKQLFLPNGLLLDAKHEIVRLISPDDFTYTNGEVGHKLFLNQDTGLRYLVLYTSPRQIGKESEMRETQVDTYALGGGAYFMNGSDMKQKLKTAEGGLLTVRALKYAPREAR